MTTACARTGQMSSGRSTAMSDGSVEAMLAGWPAKQRETAMMMVGKYGQPQVAGDRVMIWYNNGPFVKTVLSRDAVPHNFPMPHMDYLAQTVMHNVPTEKFDELAEYDGSVWVHRTRGEISAQCDVEAMNFLALNLAHDIAMGRRSVEDARMMYARTAKAFKDGDQSSPYVRGLIFQQMRNAADPDRPTM